MSKILKGRGLSKGIVEGEAIITKQPFSITAAFAFPLISNAKRLKVAERTHEVCILSMCYSPLSFGKECKQTEKALTSQKVENMGKMVCPFDYTDSSME